MAATRQSSGGPVAAPAAHEQEIVRLSIDTVRALSMDAVQKANAGHPGTAMALAPLGYLLFQKFLNVNPQDPSWPDRDRFVLSAGHACILQYSLNHLCGWDLALEDLQQFRQWGSRTPGHPERGVVPGVEVTTGPLGQGFANAVGMTMAERFLAERFNRPKDEVVDHRTWVICSDGDMMEGVSQEAASLAGNFALGKLIVCYDENHITIDGTTSLSFDGENHAARLADDGWHVQRVGDSEDLDALHDALLTAREEDERPSFIAIRSHIAYPAPHAVDTAKSHGAPLGEEEVAATKRAMGFDPDAHFHVDERVYEHMSLREQGAAAQQEWSERFQRWRGEHPEMAEDWDRAWSGRLRDGWQDALPSFPAGEELATRAAGQKTMAAFSRVRAHDDGRRGRPGGVHQDGVRGRRPVRRRARRAQCSLRDPRARDGLDRQRRRGPRRDRQTVRLDVPDLLRLHARGRAPVGADGDPGGVGLDARLDRPRRGRSHPPAGRALHGAARDPLPVGDPPGRRQRDRRRLAGGAGTSGRTGCAAALPPGDPGARPFPHGIGRGVAAGRLRAVGFARQRRRGRHPELILISTGAEVAQALTAGEEIAAEGRRVRVVSMPCMELFEAQSAEYREQVLPAASTARLAIEPGASMSWWKWVGTHGDVVGLDRFGASAPGTTVLEKLGFGAPHIAERARALLARDTN